MGDDCDDGHLGVGTHVLKRWWVQPFAVEVEANSADPNIFCLALKGRAYVQFVCLFVLFCLFVCLFCLFVLFVCLFVLFVCFVCLLLLLFVVW